MELLKKKIESIMNDNGMQKGIPTERFLMGLSHCYGSMMKIRDRFFQKHPERSRRLPCMVISVGNITVGGTGKTPMTVYLAKMLMDAGYRIAIVSRGYGGKASKTGGIVCDGKKILLPTHMAGDEPYMMAKQLHDVPIVVWSNRYQAGILAIEKFSPDILLLDDGFQHRKLKRDLDILLLDANHPFGNGHLLPRGTLREPVAMIQRADIMILTRAGSSAPEKPLLKQLSKNGLESFAEHTPLFLSSHKPYLHSIIPCGDREIGRYTISSQNDPPSLAEKSVFAFSGIARNYDFRESAVSLGCRISGYLEFPDHHEYSDSDFSGIVQAARENNAEMIITTEKDYSRIAGFIQWPLPLAVIGVSILIQEDGAFQNLILKKIQHHLS
ncbi:MAG: tetraacyldisaccharide 4'-kinase [Desulfobacterium sp.]|nr:tetraacyldisaccharide 4'-kinase [Desulfobacterium sp.]